MTNNCLIDHIRIQTLVDTTGLTPVKPLLYGHIKQAETDYRKYVLKWSLLEKDVGRYSEESGMAI